MVFTVAHIVSYLTRFMSLHPGDIITTGTPPGVGSGQKPPQFLRPGDKIQLGVQGLGEQNQTVVASSWGSGRFATPRAPFEGGLGEHLPAPKTQKA
jgi:Fumarylacetoacetate (FAA) hydrolase family